MSTKKGNLMRSIFGPALGVIFLSGVANAGHVEPVQAKKVSASLVSAYEQCDTPNTAAQSSALTSACTPPVPAATFGCSFAPGGSGKMTAALTGDPAAGTQDIKLAAVAKGLNSNCEAENLCMWFTLRVTTDDCPEGSCTLVDVDRFAFDLSTCCVVTKGACKIKTTFNAAFPGLLENNKTSGIEVRGCGLSPTFPGLTGPAVACGLLLK